MGRDGPGKQVVSMDVLSNLLGNPEVNMDTRATELRSQVLMLMKLESFFAYWQEES